MIEPGEVVGHYRVLERIGGGGMGVVYRATDLTLGREVAIKVLPPNTDATDAILRFTREARTLSGLNHPNICTVYEFGEHQAQPYLVMELLRGTTLADRINGRPIDPLRLLWIGEQVARGLAAAHAAGLVHRDIKPANIAISAHDEIKILDFGLAKAPTSSLPDATTLTGTAVTQAGLTVGTVAYMSPEQARGESVDARSDLFSFGAVLYEMATGRRPFDGGSTIRTLEAVLRDTPPAPRVLNPAVPTALERIILKALEKDPAGRYQRAEEIGSDLAALAHGIPAAPAPPAGRRVRAVVGAAVLALLASLFWFLSARRAPALTDKDTLLITDVENTSGDAVVDGALRQALAIDLEQSPYLSLIGDDRLRLTLKQMGKADGKATRDTVKDLSERTGAAVAVVPSVTMLGNSYVVSLEAVSGRTGDVVAREQAQAPREQILTAVSKASARMRRKLGESSASIQRFDVPLSDATTPSLEALRAYSHARELLVSSRYKDAIPFFQEAISHDPNFASAYSGLSIAYSNFAVWTPETRAHATEAAARAYALRAHTTERERYAIEASYHTSRGDWIGAKEPLELAVKTYPRYLPFHSNLSNVYGRLGRVDDAIREAREAQALNPRAAVVYGNLSWFLRLAGRFDEMQQVAAEAKRMGLDSWLVHLNVYTAAIARGDVSVRDAEIAWAQGRPEGERVRTAEVERAISEGRFADAERAGREDSLVASVDEFAWYFALSGDCARARHMNAVGMKSLSPGAAAAAAFCGDTAKVRSTLPRVEAIEGADTAVHVFWVPITRAALTIAAHDWTSARRELGPSLPYELTSQADYDPTYLMGLIALGENDGARAATEFQKIIDHPALAPFSPLASLAWLGLARAAALTHDIERSRKAYSTFFARWQHADGNLSFLAGARAEYARLQ